MPLYSDLGLYYSPHLTTPSYYSSPFLGTSARSSGTLGLGLMPVPRLLPSRVSPLMPSIPESGYLSARRALPSLDRTASPRPLPRYMPPKPVHIDTADIDVSSSSSSRFGQHRDAPALEAPVGGDPSRQATIKRGRTVVRLHTKKFKENPALDAREAHRRMTPGERLMQKFLILDKAEEEAKAARRRRIEEQEERERVEVEVARLQAMAAKKEADALGAPAAPDGTFPQETDATPPTQNFPSIQGLTENAALDILLSAAEDDEEQIQGGEISRKESTGTVKKRKIKDKDGTVKATKKKTKKKDGAQKSESSTPYDSPATGDEMVEKCTLQRRNTVRFRRNSQDVEGFPEVDGVPGSRRSSFDLTPSSRRSSIDQSPSSRRSSIDSTGDEIPLASEKKSTVKRRKGPKHKIVADVSVDNSPTREPLSPKFVVDDVKVEQSSTSPRVAPKKFRYEVIVEDVEEERAAGRRGKSGKENKVEAPVKKKGKVAAGKATELETKAASKIEESQGVKAVKKEKVPKAFQKSRLEESVETKTQVADIKTEEVASKQTQQKNKEEIAQDVQTQKLVMQERNKQIVVDKVDDKRNKVENQSQDTKIDKKEKLALSNDKKVSGVSKVDANNVQKGLFAVEKPKPPMLTSVVSKVEEVKVGKQVIEKTKPSKHQPDPTPPPTPTLQKSDSGINFWAFLNGSEEEPESKKLTLPKQEPIVQTELNKTDKPKAVKGKPDLHLNLQNRFAPADKIMESEEDDMKPTLLGKKVIDKKGKFSEEKPGNLPQKRGVLSKYNSLDATQDAKRSGKQMESQIASPKTSLVQESASPTPKSAKDDKKTAGAASVDTPSKTKRSDLPSPTSEDIVPKWKVQAKDNTKTPDTPDSTRTKGKFGADLKKKLDTSPLDKTEEKSKENDTIASIIPKKDQIKPVEETPRTTQLKEEENKKFANRDQTKSFVTPVAEVPKMPETPEKKPPPKWKAFGKLPSPTSESPKETVLSPKTPATPDSKNADAKPKTQVFSSYPEAAKISDEAPKVPSPTRDDADGLEKSPTTKEVVPDTQKITDQNQKAKSPWGPQPKGSSAGEDLLKKKALKTQDSKEDKENKVTTSNEDTKPVPKWKVKAQADKDAELKKYPLGKIKQTADKPVVNTSASEPSSTEQPKTTALTETISPATAKEKSSEETVTQAVTNTEAKNQSTVPQTPTESEKPPKTPFGKNKAVVKIEEKSPKESGHEQKALASPTSSLPKGPKEVESKKEEVVEKPKDKFPFGKPKLTEQKSKEEEKDARIPFGKKVKVPEQKSLDKKKEESVSSTETKKVSLPKEKSKEEEKLNVTPEPKEKNIENAEKTSAPSTPVKKGAKLIGQKDNDKDKKEPLKTIVPVVDQKDKDGKEPLTPIKKIGQLPGQKSEDKLEEKEPTTPTKKPPKLAALKIKDEEKSEQLSPLKKAAKLTAQKSKEDVNEAPPSPVKKVGKLAAQKSKEDSSEPSSPIKKTPKLPAQTDKEEEKTEPKSPVKKIAKLPAQKSKEEEEKSEPPSPLKKKPIAKKSKEEEDKPEPSSPVKKGDKLVTQKSKEEEAKPKPSPLKKKPIAQKSKEEEEKQEPSSPIKKGAKLVTQKSGEEKSSPTSPVKKGAKLITQKSKEDEKTDATPTAAKKGAKLMAQKSKEETSDTKTAAAGAGKAKPKSAEAKKTTPSPAPSPATESGSDADSEDSSSSDEDDEGESTPRASASSSSCSSSDSGFDSRPSSVPVPSTASSDASCREAGSASPSPSSLARSQALDPYSEDAGLLPRAAVSGRTTPPATSLPRYRKYTVDDFQFLKLLGKGSFGKVLLAELRGTDRHYAVKCLKKDVVLEDDDVECTLIERKVLALGTKHPYLCHLFCTFQTESHLLFVMEYLNGGDLMFHIQQSGRFQEHRARFYAAEIVSGLKFLHKKGIIYRDLKLDNILLDFEGHVRIADFGMCKLQIFLDRTADTFCGTPDYMAPEIIKGLKYNQCVDWWSFGVLVFEMLVGVSPFTGCDEDELFWSICNDQPQYPRFLSREAHSLLTSLLEKDALKRLGTPESPKGDVPDHVFFRSVDWDALERRELDPPFRPRVKHPLDVQYFDSAFTAERAELTPVDTSILQSMDQAQFQGFSYTNPNATD